MYRAGSTSTAGFQFKLSPTRSCRLNVSAGLKFEIKYEIKVHTKFKWKAEIMYM
jgi:hypothetical protein